ncbi:MarR family transcriptional regulator [Novosphingobium bradum]|uniref:MarR family transcriptional regulator n=1 Tax=Novosphingobium bradum TaxID=1737444 RepID=A0ABV7ISV8_9SPHN
MINDDHTIGIILMESRMGRLDDLEFLDQITAMRPFCAPIIPIVITDDCSLVHGVAALRAGARDLLSLPMSQDVFASALRRAARAWHRLRSREQLVLGAQPGSPMTHSPKMDGAAQLAQLKLLIHDQHLRHVHVGEQLFCDPAWDILLSVAAAGLNNKAIPVSRACASSRVPLSTALRHVTKLVEAGLIHRRKDPNDRRRDLLEPTPPTLATMANFLATG